MSATLQVLLTFKPFIPELLQLFVRLLESEANSVEAIRLKDAKIAELDGKLQEALGLLANKDAAIEQASSDDLIAAQAATELTDALREILNRALAAPVSPVPVVEEPTPVQEPAFEPEPTP